MALNTNYTRLTYQELIEDFQNRLRNDPRFKKLSSAAIYNMFMEMLSGTMDMTNFFMQRTAEECFIDTAKLESSIIKHGKTLGYNPKRPVPAQAEISITLKGPLPEGLQPGATVYFAQKETNLSFNNKKYVLSTDYSYTFTEADIENGRSSTWSKQIFLSMPSSSMKYFNISGTKEYESSETSPIIIYQGEFRTIDFAGSDNVRKLGKNYQYYDINDTSFSNWYGKRDMHTYINGKFYKESGYTKVGIGKSENEAFKNDNLFEIEDYSIYINQNVIKAQTVTEPLNVCQMVSNQDKTVRLQFGDGEIVRCGLKTADDKIFVQYFSTEGADANAVGTAGSMLNTSSRYFATQQGAVIDVTSNIQFLLESNIYGGANFEDSQSIKNNAPRYYASCDRLITKQDFISWFNGMTTPINVKNSIVMGQEGIEQDGKYYPFLQNIILYYLASDPYVINGKENTYKNPFVDDPSITEPFSIYGTADDYMNHLVDYSRLLTDFNSVYSAQYASKPEYQWQKNIKAIRELSEDRMAVDSKLLSMPPIVHLYDVYGTVEVDSLANLQKYKLDAENDVYKWLNDHTGFNSPIYKSEIIKIFNQKENTRYADLDIKVSDLIYEDVPSMTINGDFECRVNKDGDYILYNVSVPKDNYKGITVSVDTFNGKMVYLSNGSGKPLNGVPDYIYETDTDVILSFRKFGSADTNTIKYTSLKFMPNTLASQANYERSYMNSMQFAFNEIAMLDDTYKISTTPDIVASPFIPKDETGKPASYDPNGNPRVSITNGTNEITKARIESKKKKVTGDMGMTEKKFWQEFITENITTEQAINAYRFYKPAIEDSVLDDNNNIVNYSLASEMPIIRLNITYKYRK